MFPLAVLLAFLVLAALYESWMLPLAVILIVPMCVLSALIGVWLTGGDNNMFVQVGLVVLMGLACKNAILIVEFARELELQGKGTIDAALEACRLRLRPIVMTSFAFIAGVDAAGRFARRRERSAHGHGHHRVRRHARRDRCSGCSSRPCSTWRCASYGVGSAPRLHDRTVVHARQLHDRAVVHD